MQQEEPKNECRACKAWLDGQPFDTTPHTCGNVIDMKAWRKRKTIKAILNRGEKK